MIIRLYFFYNFGLMANLSENEKSRYHRHLILSEIGEKGQEKIKGSKILVVGAGGLGCPVLQYLTAAGVGSIGIMDDDKVDISNLQRQVFYGMNELGKHKAIVAAHLMKEMNSNVDFKILNIRITYGNALEIVKDFDVIVDCTDNIKARYVLNDAAVISGKPLVHASVFKYQGQLSVFNYQDGPSYRCIFPFPLNPGEEDIGILGIYSVAPGIIGLMQANEVLKIVRDEKNFDKDTLMKSFAN